MGNILNSHFFRVYIIPGCVFQSVMVGGGYGTGREVVEYFTQFGLYGGLLALLVTFAVMATVLALTFELSRLYRRYDYRRLMKVLLGPAWVVFELITLTMLPLVLAVLALTANYLGFLEGPDRTSPASRRSRASAPSGTPRSSTS